MKKIALCLALIGLLGLGGEAVADICTIEATPAASLLLPYFEVSPDQNGPQTLFSVNNASAEPTIAHVTIWSDWSVPVLDFDIYLTGYDVQTVNLYDILFSGNLPVTASVGQDPADTISPQGILSGDINYASCASTFPYNNPVLTSTFRAHLQAWLTGNQSPVTGNCAGQPVGDGILRGYVTIDSTRACSLLFPSDDGYFVDGGSGIATNDNVLWGDYFYVDSGNNFAQGETLVHVEADQAETTGLYTFYYRYTDGADNREPLGTTYATRYLNGGVFDGGTDLVVWRDSTVDTVAPVTCGGAPSWFPLGVTEIVIFDEEENPDVPDTAPVSGIPGGEQINPFPIEAQKVAINSDQFPVPFDFGWLYLNLNHNANVGFAFEPFAQAWVSTILSAEGRFSVGFDAIQLDSACDPNTAIVNLAGGGGAL